LKIISGGQTGADRAALDFAIENRLDHGGWCPRGRRAEDGAIPAIYRLRETDQSEYAFRTTLNVADSDATVIFSMRPKFGGGTALTARVAREHGRPLLHLDASLSVADSATALRRFLAKHRVRVLNVAGPRASLEPRVGSFVRAVLQAAFGPSSNNGEQVHSNSNGLGTTQE
jgi:hypothetical protein